MRRLAPTTTRAALAAQFGVSFQHVSRIVRGEKWKHLNQNKDT